jgi:hypothetical protein
LDPFGQEAIRGQLREGFQSEDIYQRRMADETEDALLETVKHPAQERRRQSEPLSATDSPFLRPTHTVAAFLR